MKSTYDLLLCNRLSYGHAASLMSQMIKMQRAVTQLHLPADVLERDIDVSQSAFAQYRYMTDFEKTALLTDEFVRCVRAKESVGQLEASRGRYATHLLLTELWCLRQLIDEHGMPYPFYISHAMQYWVNQKRTETPRAGDLLSEEILEYVLKSWSDPSARCSVPLSASRWDSRFHPEHFTGDGPQVALLKLVEQRIEDARVSGSDPVKALAILLERSISRDEAVRRFGSELADNAMKLKLDIELDEFLADLM